MVDHIFQKIASTIIPIPHALPEFAALLKSLFPLSLNLGVPLCLPQLLGCGGRDAF